MLQQKSNKRVELTPFMAGTTICQAAAYWEGVFPLTPFPHEKSAVSNSHPNLMMALSGNSPAKDSKVERLEETAERPIPSGVRLTPKSNCTPEVAGK